MLIPCFKAIKQNLQVVLSYYVCLLYIMLYYGCLHDPGPLQLYTSHAEVKIAFLLCLSTPSEINSIFFQEAIDNSASPHNDDRASGNSCSSSIHGKPVHFI